MTQWYSIFIVIGLLSYMITDLKKDSQEIRPLFIFAIFLKWLLSVVIFILVSISIRFKKPRLSLIASNLLILRLCLPLIDFDGRRNSMQPL